MVCLYSYRIRAEDQGPSPLVHAVLQVIDTLKKAAALAKQLAASILHESPTRPTAADGAMNPQRVISRLGDRQDDHSSNQPQHLAGPRRPPTVPGPALHADPLTQEHRRHSPMGALPYHVDGSSGRFQGSFCCMRNATSQFTLAGTLAGTACMGDLPFPS